MFASGRSQRSIGLGSLFDSIFLETKRQRKKFYSSSSSSSRIHIFNRPLIPLFSHRQRCVIVFEMRSIRRQSPIPPLPKKNRLVLYQIFIFAHLYAHLITPMLSNSFRIYFKFYINSTSWEPLHANLNRMYPARLVSTVENTRHALTRSTILSINWRDRGSEGVYI